jgi:NAD(P)-dependent dehydrogenase (short-subunit alcohol dehydrogenase family)
MEPLAGRVALVTGGGRGIGRAIALAFARAGANVAVASRKKQDLDAVAAEIGALGRKAFAFSLDVADRGALAAAPGRVEKALGPIDILVNNAGIAESQPLHKMDDDHWDRHLAIDLTAPFLLTRACLPGMYARGFGRVVNIASVAGKIGFLWTGAYSAAKHGLIGFTRTLALEGGKKGVTANAICPGWVDTEMMAVAVQAIAGTGKVDEKGAVDRLVGHTALGRAITAEEVAQAALLVATNGAITGQSIVVDGGGTMP